MSTEPSIVTQAKAKGWIGIHGGPPNGVFWRGVNPATGKVEELPACSEREERVIDGVLHFRASPEDIWRRMTPERLTEKLLMAQKELNEARLFAENLREFWERIEAALDDCPNGDPLPWKLPA